MDDDDYYFPDSIISKILSMIQYKKQLVYSKPIATYNLINNSNFYINFEKNNSIIILI